MPTDHEFSMSNRLYRVESKLNRVMNDRCGRLIYHKEFTLSRLVADFLWDQWRDWRVGQSNAD